MTKKSKAQCTPHTRWQERGINSTTYSWGKLSYLYSRCLLHSLVLEIDSLGEALLLEVDKMENCRGILPVVGMANKGGRWKHGKDAARAGFRDTE